MQRSPLVLAVALVLCGSTAASARATTLCVAHRPGCSTDLQKALDAARDGDTIVLGPGEYRGGVTITHSVALRGAAADATRIAGGGPVVTVQAPKVVISGVTVTGGVTTSFQGQSNLALGGGLFIAPETTVTLSDSAVVGNVAAPTTTVPSDDATCPDGPCPFAGGFGGGIFSNGELTLTRVTVAGNRVGTRPGAAPVASDAEGGGIFATGPLTVTDSRIAGNASIAEAPNGHDATAGGIFHFAGALILRRTTVTGNRVVLHSTWPASVAQGIIGGGVFVDDQSTATIEGSHITGNELLATNPVGDAIAFSGGVHGNGRVILRDSDVSHNRVTAVAPAGSHGRASADSGMGNFNMPSEITRTRLVGNVVTARAGDGPAIAAAGALWAWADDPIEMRASTVTDNRVTAAGEGEVTAFGGGVVNTDVLSVQASLVAGNAVRGAGPSGTAQGGGIWNARTPDSADFVPRLTVADSLIADNAVSGSPGVTVRGGGVFSSEPFTLARTRLLHNRPEDCAGC
jgi:nitrous oxidase accessory protein NosD